METFAQKGMETLIKERYGNIFSMGMETFPKKGMETFSFFTATCYQTKKGTRPYVDASYVCVHEYVSFLGLSLIHI